ncbi:hypothetical protein [Moraxella sp. VT-16-12]|uniref:hypothetical protein n=1 Tax=Moraxella sp. VT-16-12 TaxID=2014877 RepID=UPI000B7FE496|nr:hypothetical protein [Moraxella sp. VT-16-12]TWV82041.1 hypothetical protein CEW93_007105 [Moraxella sp. VT-16-12]
MKEYYQRLQATNKLLADICKRHNLNNATVIDKDGNELLMTHIINDNVDFAKTGGWISVVTSYHQIIHLFLST